MHPSIVLASASPRRRELLSLLHQSFRIVSADIDETPLPDETPAQMVVRLSIAKAQAVATALVANDYEASLIIASDTTVVFQGQILGKPRDRGEATAMLHSMRGRAHMVYSGLALLNGTTGDCYHDLAATKVVMRNYDEAELAAYVASDDPLDKAGAYGIQNEAFHPVKRVHGCYASVMGFPLCHLYRLWQRLGAGPAETPVHACLAFTGHDCQVYDQILDHENDEEMRQ